VPNDEEKTGYLTAAGPPGAVLCVMTLVLTALGALGVWPSVDRTESRPFESDVVMMEVSPPNRPQGIYAFFGDSYIGEERFSSGAAELALGRKMDLCRARVSDLTLLPGIGPKRARFLAAYIKYAEKIETIEDLAEAPGIGPETIAGLKPWAKLNACGKTDIKP
jgi:DNA uptake protein ComE-like DNA-binding protein